LSERLASALQASAHHYERTSRCFYITQAIVESEKAFEELEEEEQFLDPDLKLPKNFDVEQLYREHLDLMAEIPGFYNQAPQHASQCALQVPQQYPDFQNDVDEMDAYINYPEPDQVTQTHQSQADNFMDDSSAAAELEVDIPDFDNIIEGQSGLSSNDLLGSLAFSSPELQVSRQVSSASVGQVISYISDSQYQYSQEPFLLSVSPNTNTCQPHSNVVRSDPLCKTVDKLFGNATSTGYTSDTRTNNRQPHSQNAFDDLQNTGVRGKMPEKELKQMQAVDAAKDKDGNEQTGRSEFEREA
jgi:hypothetical protein